MIDLELIMQSLPALLQGTYISLQITSIATCLGLLLGTLLAFGNAVGSRLVQGILFGYITLVRGTPMLVQILFVYYALAQYGIRIDPFWAASIAIGCNSGAYVSQIIQSGINAIPQGQFDAAKTLGFSNVQTMRHIVFPQAFKIALPALGNELITLVKDSSLASIIGVMELSKEASIIRSRTYDVFSVLLAVSVIYLALTGAISFITKKLSEQKKVDARS